MSYPAAAPHGSFEEVFPNVFVVEGVFAMSKLVRIQRNMTVIRDGDELTLVNGIRLTPEGEKKLEALGTVKHMVRIGAFHGVDEPYLKERYAPTFWAQEGQRGKLKADEVLAEGRTPIEASFFEFEKARHKEGALILPQDDGILLTCDSVQNIQSTRGCSFAAKMFVHVAGMLRPANIGGPWRKEMTPKGNSLQPDFERLLGLPFRHLISGHGDVNHTVKEDLQKTIQHVYG